MRKGRHRGLNPMADHHFGRMSALLDDGSIRRVHGKPPAYASDRGQAMRWTDQKMPLAPLLPSCSVTVAPVAL